MWYFQTYSKIIVIHICIFYFKSSVCLTSNGYIYELFIFHENVARLLMSCITDNNLESRLLSTSFVPAYTLKVKVKVT